MFSEKEIQQQIWQQRDNWFEIIDRAEIPEPYSFSEDLSDLTLERLVQNNLYKQLSLIDAALRETELIGCEVPLHKQGDSTIRADFLGVSLGKPGFVILELKKSNQTERESFTELLAYSNHITTAFPPMCKEDIYYILIAPMDGRIVREALIQSLIFDRKLIYALIPYFTNPNMIQSLRLKPWIPDLETLSPITGAVFESKNFSVKIVWEHSSEWCIEDALDVINVKSRFNRISAFAAQIMEHRGIHGFVFSSQVWPELVEVLPFANSLVIVALNPYAIANSLFEPYTTIGFDITKVLPGLKKSLENLSDKDNYHFNLYSYWDSHLFEIGFQVLKQALQNINGEEIRLDWGSMSWADYKHEFLEYIACENFDIRPTGILRELYWDVTNID